MNCWTQFEKQAFIVDDLLREQSTAAKIKPFCHCFVIMTQKMTDADETKWCWFGIFWKNWELSGKFFSGKKNARLALSYNPKGMMGNGQENNGGRCSGLFFGNIYVKSWKIPVWKEYNPTEFIEATLQFLPWWEYTEKGTCGNLL